MKHLLTLLVFAIAATVIGADTEPNSQTSQRAAMQRAAEFRTFTTTNGITFEGRPVGFTESKGIAKLLVKEGGNQFVELKSLSQKDQEYILDWYPTYLLLRKNKFRFEVAKNIKEEKLYDGTLEDWAVMFPNMEYSKEWHSCYPGTTYNECFYTITTENRSKELQKNIKFEYCIYHQTEIEEMISETERVNAGTDMAGWAPVGSPQFLEPVTVLNTISGTLEIKTLSEREKKSVHTSAVRLIEEAEEFKSENASGELVNGTRGKRNTRNIKGKLMGIRYRVYLPTPNGEYAMMEFAEPKKLLKTTEWPSE